MAGCHDCAMAYISCDVSQSLSNHDLLLGRASIQLTHGSFCTKDHIGTASASHSRSPYKGLRSATFSRTEQAWPPSRSADSQPPSAAPTRSHQPQSAPVSIIPLGTDKLSRPRASSLPITDTTPLIHLQHSLARIALTIRRPCRTGGEVVSF